MGKLIYAMNVSLDGYIETPDRSLDWSTVDEELHTWFNEHTRSLQVELYGRRLYELMYGYWPTAEADPDATPAMLEFARIWMETPRIVFSSTLDRVERNARLVRGDVGDVLKQLRTEFDGDMGVAGPNLAGQFVQRGLVDEYRLVVHPVILGAGTPFFPSLEQPARLRLFDSRRFESGVQYLGYQVA